MLVALGIQVAPKLPSVRVFTNAKFSVLFPESTLKPRNIDASGIPVLLYDRMPVTSILRLLEEAVLLQYISNTGLAVGSGLGVGTGVTVGTGVAVGVGVGVAKGKGLAERASEIQLKIMRIVTSKPISFVVLVIVPDLPLVFFCHLSGGIGWYEFKGF